MPKIIAVIASVLLVVHALIHLMGTVVYMKLGSIEGLNYKTTLLGGHWDLGEGGIRIFGVLWAVAALGFITAMIAFWAGWDWWHMVLTGVTVFSLALTLLDYNSAYAGVAVNVVILIALIFGPRPAVIFQ